MVQAQLHVHVLVALVTLVFVQAVHRVVFGAVAIAVVHHQLPHTQSIINFVVQVALVVHQLSPAQVQVQGQVPDTALAVVQLAHRFSVGFVFEFVLFAVPQVQSTINCVVQVALVVHQFNPAQVQIQGQVPDTALAVVQLAHRFSVGLVFEFVLFAVPHTPSMVKLVVQVALVVHQLSPAQVQVQGQVPDTALAVVQFAHRFSVGFVFEFVLFAIPHAQAIISSSQVSHV